MVHLDELIDSLNLEHYRLLRITLSELTAYEAAQNPEVQSLRDRIGPPIPESEVPVWIGAHGQGGPREWTENGVGYGEWPTVRVATSLEPEGIRSWKVGDGSPAAAVGTLATRLEADYRWVPGTAARWLLTGVMPEVVIFEFGINSTSGRRASQRITITIDPLLKPNEVKAIYEAARAAVLTHRPRSIETKNLQLVRFALGHPDLSVRDLMERWNREFGHIKMYQNPRHFNRDIKATLRRLSDSPLRGFARPKAD